MARGSSRCFTHTVSLQPNNPERQELAFYPFLDERAELRKQLCPRAQWAKPWAQWGQTTEPKATPQQSTPHSFGVCGKAPTLVSTHQPLAHTGNLHVAKGLELAHLLCSERVLPHGGVHGRAEEERLAEVPGPDDTGL